MIRTNIDAGLPLPSSTNTESALRVRPGPEQLYTPLARMVPSSAEGIGVELRDDRLA